MSFDNYWDFGKACETGDVGQVKEFISQGANVNASNHYRNTPLILASDKGAKEIVDVLIAKGADVNVKSDTNKTPLNYALEKGHNKVVELLKTAGAKG